MRHDGGLLITLGALLGLGVSVYNYFAPVSLLAPQSSIAGTPGALLVVVSTTILLVFGLVLAGRGEGRRAVVGFAAVAVLAAILGTGLAAQLLGSEVLLACMLMCLIGWLLRVFTRQPGAA